MSPATPLLATPAPAVFTQTGDNGLHTTPNLIFGNQATGSGTYDLSGGSLSVGFEYIGNAGTGSFTQSGGTHTVALRGWRRPPLPGNGRQRFL